MSKDGNLIPLVLRRLDNGTLRRRAFDVGRIMYGAAMIAIWLGVLAFALVAFGEWP